MSQINKSKIIFLFLLIPVLVNAKFNNEKDTSKKRYKSIYISGHYDTGIKHGDSIIITLWKDLLSVNKSTYMPHRNFRVGIKNGNFRIRIDSVDNISYISLSDYNNKWGEAYNFLDFYLAEPGDNIHLNITKIAIARPRNLQTKSGDSTCINCNNVVFSGKGADKYNCRFKADKVFADSLDIYNSEETRKEYKRISAFEKQGLNPPVPSLYEESQSLQKKVNYFERVVSKVLVTYKQKLSKEVYQILRANLVGEIQGQFYARPMSIIIPYRTPILKDYKKLYTSMYYEKTYGISEATALRSVNYLDFLIIRSQLENYLYNFDFSTPLSNSEKQQLRITSTYDFIKKSYSGILKEKLLLSYLVNHSSVVSNPSTLIEDGLHTIKTKEYRDLLNSVTLSSQVGRKAYNFSLPDSNDQNITLDKFKGKVVFIDFWFTGCYACSKYYTGVVSKVEEIYRHDSNVVFISISLDANKKNWEKGIQSGLYTSRNIINLYKATSSPVIKQFSVDACPHPVLVDKNGLIFSNSSIELRTNGVSGLEKKINQALSLK